MSAGTGRLAPPGEDLEAQQRRADRTLRFCADQAAQLRRELQLDLGGCPPALRPLLAQLEAVEALAARKRRGLAACRTPEALARLGLEELVRAHKALLALAQPHRRGSGALPPPPAAPPRATGPIAARPVTGPIAPRPSLTARLQDLFAPRQARPEPAPAPEPAGPDARRRRHLETFVVFGRQVLDGASPRLTAVATALDTTSRHGGKGLPASQVCELGSEAAAAAGVEPPLMVWIPRLVRLNLAHPTAPRVEKQALGEWGDARGRHAEARGLLLRLRAGDGAALAAYEPTRAGAALMPLTHLPTTFREVPVLNELFPALRAQPPEWQRWRRDLDAWAAPAPAARRPAPAAPPDGEDASRRRLSAIVAYLQDPAGDPAYQDPTVMFRIMAEEHQHHAARRAAIDERLATLPADDPLRAALAADRDVARLREQQMSALLRQLAAKGRPAG